MPARKITIGAVAYRRADMDHIGAWGYFGEEVDVHDSDVARFDAANSVDPVEPNSVEPLVEPLPRSTRRAAKS